MNILFVLANYYPYVGGSELLFQRLAEGLVKKGHYVKVITSGKPGLAKHERIHGVDVERVKLPISENPFLFTLVSIPRLIKQVSQFEIIQTSSNYSALAAYLGSLFGKAKIVITCHEVLGERWEFVLASKRKSFIYQFIEKMIVSLPYDHHVCISNATKNDLIQTGVEAGQVQVIYPGVDLEGEEIQPSSENELSNLFSQADFNYVYYGRPGVTKGVHYLVDAVPEISRKIPGSQLLMILSSSPAAEYEKIKLAIREKKLVDKVTLVPTFSDRKDLFAFLSQSNCIVIPSLTEGFGFTTVEASSLDVPVVASASGSIPEVVFGNFVLVEAGSATAIAEGVVRVFNGDLDYLKAKDFNWDTMVNEYEQCYLSEING
ncbi:MAG: glycosyltransferase family 4 protein [Chloroflexota bacterium]